MYFIYKYKQKKIQNYDKITPTGTCAI